MVQNNRRKNIRFSARNVQILKSDVDILRRGCMKLRELFIQIDNVDPFQYITIGVVYQAIYRSEFSPEITIGVCSESPVDNYSTKSIKWLKYVSLSQNINIRHACNGGEQAIRVNGKTYKVDGYCNQFHDCYFKTLH